jgi:hypothetical protein
VQQPLAPERIGQVFRAADIVGGFAAIFGWLAHGNRSRCGTGIGCG